MGILKDFLGIKFPSEHYLGGNHLDPHQAAQFTPPPMPKTVIIHTPSGPAAVNPDRVILRHNADGRRPCWARGRKAMFHRWVESAHPVPPRNIQAAQIDEKTRYFQYSSTQALVEFEDGTCARVWPNEVQFADLGGFDEYAWRPMTEGGREDGAE